MLFKVEVLSQGDYDAKMAELNQGKVGADENPNQEFYFGDGAKAENE